MKEECFFRLPYSKEITIVSSNECIALKSIDELKGKSGFIMIPFNTNGNHDILLFPGNKTKTTSVPEVSRKCNTKIAHIDCISNNYQNSFNTFIKALKENRFTKLVLSRSSSYDINATPEDIEEIFYEACRKYPRMMVWMCRRGNGDTWMGCTPEIIIDGEKSHYRTVALAGTMLGDSDDNIGQQDMEWSDKNKKEQRIVAEYIRSRIRPYCEVLEEEGPYTSRAGHLLHLKTEFHFTPLHDKTAVDFINTLHPTPAVCGFPMEDARRFITENEGYDRSYYAGVVGWLDENNATHLYVNLRNARIKDGKMTLYAGGGILTDSEVQAEWNETEYKMRTLRALFQ